MATNASTWFYNEPEHRAYLIEERVNHTFWSNRISALYLDCTNDTPPFQMEGEWRGIPLKLEWVPNDYFSLATEPVDDVNLLLAGVQEILGFAPTISYVNPDGIMITEWHVNDVERRIQSIQGNPNYHQIKRYTR